MADILSEARKRHEMEKNDDLQKKRIIRKSALEERERIQKSIEEEKVRLEMERMEIEIRARQKVLEDEAQRLANEREAEVQAELERLRNRTPLEILQDEVETLREQLAHALEVCAETEESLRVAREAQETMVATRVKELEDARGAEIRKLHMETKACREEMNVLLGKETLSTAQTEALCKAWPKLQSWKKLKHETQAHYNSWTVQEVLHFQSDAYSGTPNGTLQDAYKVDEYKAALDRAEMEYHDLRVRYCPTTVARDKLQKDQSDPTLTQAQRNAAQQTLQNMNANSQPIFQQENQAWAQVKEKELLEKKKSDALALYNRANACKTSFETLLKTDKDLRAREEDIQKETGFDNCDVAWNLAFKIILARRTA